MRRKFTWAAAISILALGAGCAAPQGGAPAAGAAVPNPSGFLQDYSRLRPVPGREGRYVWTVPEAELRTYTSFLLPPMEIWIDPDAQVRGMAADAIQRLSAAYQSSFRAVLAPEYPVVDKPGPGVATCRFALTGLTPERPGLTPLDVVPIKAAFNVVRSATGTAARVARISAEIACYDSVSNRLLAEALITGVGERKFAEDEPILWSDVDAVLRGWAQDFKQRFNVAHGR
jgi:hypothetical protein